MKNRTLKQLTSWFVCVSLVYVPVVHAGGVQTDATTQTAVEKAANGVPIVNIANPNAQGLSHNRFKEYNVDQKGLILNNSCATTVKTQLAGYIYGNKNLTSNAKVILNEVTSTSKTRLSGYTEVAGKRADLVVANPNGITIDGAGFINTANVTLVTGRPNIVNGTIDSYAIREGQIDIEGKGLDATQSDSATLYTKALQLNAKIYANVLNLKLGSNSSTPSTLLLDSSALGGMYANAITLVGTDKGVGVNLPPEVVASNGDITITNDGYIKLQNLRASGDISVESKTSDITIGDDMTAAHDINLGAETITNDALVNGGNDVTLKAKNFVNNETLFGANDLYLYVAQTLWNKEDANILALGSLTMAADASNAKTLLIKNESANIETLNGDINIFAKSFENRATTVPVVYEVKRTKYSQTRYLPSSWRVHETITTVTEAMDKDGYKPAVMSSGRNLVVHADMTNSYSLVSADNDIEFQGTLTNMANLVAYKRVFTYGYYQHYEKKHKHYGGHGWYHKYDKNTVQLTPLDSADSTVQAGGSITGSVGKLVNGTVQENTDTSNATLLVKNEDNIAIKSGTNISLNIVIPTGDSSLFVKASPESHYLIETNPELAVYENFISSDYMMQHIDYDAVATSKRLGDALYENRLVRESIFKQTGKRFLSSELKSDDEQYRYLMDNAIEASRELELVPGVSLSQEQVKALKKDIVWMEKKSVAGEEVLVPVVYIANVDDIKLKGSKIIAANDVILTSESVNNSGAVVAGNEMDIDAQKSIVNRGGVLKAKETLTLRTKNDIKNISSTIKAKNVTLSAEGDIVNNRFARDVSLGAKKANTATGLYAASTESGSAKERKTLIGEESVIQATESLDIESAKSFTNEGSRLVAKDLDIKANDATITTTVDKKDFFGGGSSAYIKEKSTTHLASNIDADNIRINTKEATEITASNLKAKDTLEIQAGSIKIKAATDSSYRETHSESKGLLSSSASTNIQLKESVVQTTVTAKNVLMTALGDVELESADINARESVGIYSTNGNVNLTAKTYTNAEFHEHSSSRWGGLSGKHSVDSLKNTRLADAATTAKNSISVGGENINIYANELQAQTGVLALRANKDISVAGAQEYSSEEHIRESKSISLDFQKNGKFTYAEVKEESRAKSQTTNKASHLVANTILFQSGGDTNIVASNAKADSMLVKAGKNFNVTAAKDTRLQSTRHSTKKLGMELKLTTKESSLFAGYWEDSNGKTTLQQNVAKSTLTAGTLDVKANTVRVEGSDFVTQNTRIDSRQTKLLSAVSSTTTKTYTKSVKSGISVGVKQNISDAIDTMKSIDDAQSDTGTFSRALQTYDAINSFLQKPVDAGVNTVYEEQTTSTSSYSQQQVASNIFANTDIYLHANDTLEVAGSNVFANRNITLDAKQINLHATAAHYSSTTRTRSKNAKANIYGPDAGTLTLGFGQSDSELTGSIYTNAHITAGNKATLHSKEDMTLKGAVVEANELEVDVARNLYMQSMQDTQSMHGSSKGGSVSGNVLEMIPTGVSAYHGTSKAQRAWVNEVTALNAKKSIKVEVKDTTTLIGAAVTNKDANGQDQGALQFTTKKLKTQDLHDYDTYASTNVAMSVGSISSDPALNSINFANATKDKEQIVRATVGKGVVTTDSDTRSLNRDITKTKEITKDESSDIELYASDSSVKALSDPTRTYEELKQKAKDVGLSAHKEIQENLPSAAKGKGVIDQTIGAMVDAAGKWAFGVIPTVSNDGGYITQIATQLFGDNREIIVAKDATQFEKWHLKAKDPKHPNKDWDYESYTTADGQIRYRTNPNKAVRIDEKADANAPLDAYKIHLTSQDIKDAKLNTIFTNGLNNKAAEAINNQQEQQANPSIGMINYNTSHGTLADLLIETTLEKSTIIFDKIPGVQSVGYFINGSARQTGDNIVQLAHINKGNIHIAAHSQGTQQTYLGLQQHKEELSKELKANPNSTLTLQNSGSSVNAKSVEDLIVNDIYGGEQVVNDRTKNGKTDVFRSQVNPGDIIGALGGNFAGVNHTEEFFSEAFWSGLLYDMKRGVPTLMRGGIKNNKTDPSKTSPHSGYPCVIGCGDGGVTPGDIKKYFNPQTNKDVSLFDYYDTIHVDSSQAKFNTSGE